MSSVERSYRVAIATKYLPPTNTRGARIAVWRADGPYRDDPDSIRVSWDHAEDIGENHRAAIAEYLERKRSSGNDWTTGGHWITGGTDTGQTAVFVPFPGGTSPDSLHRGDHSIVITYARPSDRDDAYHALCDRFGTGEGN